MYKSDTHTHSVCEVLRLAKQFFPEETNKLASAHIYTHKGGEGSPMVRKNRDVPMENLERQLDVLETSLHSGKPQCKLSRAWLHTTTEHQHSHLNSPATSQVKDLAQEAEEMLQRSASRHRQENLFMEAKIADLEGQRAKAQERERERENAREKETSEREREREETRKRVMAFEQRVLQIEREREREQMQHVRDGQARDKEQAARLQQQQEVAAAQKRELETAARSLRQLQQEMQELEHELQHERRRLERQTMEALQLTQLLQERNVLIQTQTEEINGLKDLVRSQSVQIQTQQEHAQSALANNHALIFDREQEKREKEQIICAMRDLDQGLTAKYEDCASDLERAKQLNHNLHKAVEKSESESRELLVQLDLLRARLSAAELAMDNQVIFLKHQYAAQLSESEERMIRTLTQYEDEIFMLRSQIPKAFSLGVDKSYLSDMKDLIGSLSQQNTLPRSCAAGLESLSGRGGVGLTEQHTLNTGSHSLGRDAMMTPQNESPSTRRVKDTLELIQEEVENEIAAIRDSGNAAAAGKWGEMEWKEWESTKEKRRKENKVHLSSARIKPNASRQSM